MTYTLEKPSATSAGLMNASMLVYLFWLLLPAVQTTGRAATGAAAVASRGNGSVMKTMERRRRTGPAADPGNQPLRQAAF